MEQSVGELIERLHDPRLVGNPGSPASPGSARLRGTHRSEPFFIGVAGGAPPAPAPAPRVPWAATCLWGCVHRRRVQQQQQQQRQQRCTHAWLGRGCRGCTRELHTPAHPPKPMP